MYIQIYRYIYFLIANVTQLNSAPNMENKKGNTVLNFRKLHHLDIFKLPVVRLNVCKESLPIGISSQLGKYHFGSLHNLT